MRFPSSLLFVSWLCLVLGCGGGGTEQDYMRSANPASAGGEGKAAENGDQDADAKADLPGETVARKIIYTATVSMRVADLDKAHEQLKKMLDPEKEYISSSNVTGEKGSYREGTWTVRIPVAHYREFLDGVKKLGEVSQETSSAQDVSEEYYDLEARVKNKRIEEERLVEHLKKSTGKLEDILAVEKELSRVRGEIEQAEGRFRYLTNRTDLTTITIHLSELNKYNPESSPGFGTRSSRTWSDSVESLWDFLQGVILVLIAITPWLPVIAIGGLVGWWMLKRYGHSLSVGDQPVVNEAQHTMEGDDR